MTLLVLKRDSLRTHQVHFLKLKRSNFDTWVRYYKALLLYLCDSWLFEVGHLVVQKIFDELQTILDLTLLELDACSLCQNLTKQLAIWFKKLAKVIRGRTEELLIFIIKFTKSKFKWIDFTCSSRWMPLQVDYMAS